MCCCMGIGPLWARSEGSGNVQSSGGSSNDTQREQREIARISRHQQQQQHAGDGDSSDDDDGDGSSDARAMVEPSGQHRVRAHGEQQSRRQQRQHNASV